MDYEIWKPIEGYEGYYQVSTFGNVRSLDRLVLDKNCKSRFIKGVQIKPCVHHKGYLEVHLSKDNEEKIFKVHRLVAQAFIPNPEGLPQINHKNCDKTDNHVFNLEWCTNTENHKHKIDNGLNMVSRGEKNGFSKLTTEQVSYIKTNYKPRSKTLGMRALAKTFNVSESCIWGIVSGKFWKEV